MEPNQFSAGAYSLSTPPKRSILKIVLLTFGIITAVIIVAGGAVTFFVMRADPEKVLSQMMDGISNIKIIDVDQELAIDFAPKTPVKNPLASIYPGLPKEIKNVSIKMLAHQASDFTQPRSTQAKASSRVDTSITVNGEQLARGVVDVRMLNEHIYTRLERLDIDLIGIAIEQTKWLDIDTKNKMLASVMKESKITDEQTSKISKLTMHTKFIKIKEDKGIEWKGYVPTHHYLFTVDSKALSDYLVNVERIITGSTGVVSSLSSSSLDFEKTVNKIMPEGELWVTVFGQMPYSVRLPFSMDSYTALLGLIDPSLADSSLKVVWSITVGDVNKQIKVDVPEKTMSLDTFTNMMESQMGNARAKGQDASVKSSLANMRALAELWYDNNKNKYANKAYPYGACPTFSATSFPKAMNSFFEDQQVLMTLHGVRSIVGQDGLACMASPNAWATVAKLPSGEGKRGDDIPDAVCVDSKGHILYYAYPNFGQPGLLSDLIDQKTISCMPAPGTPLAPPLISF